MNRAANDWPEHTAGRHLLSVVQSATYTMDSYIIIIEVNAYTERL